MRLALIALLAVLSWSASAFGLSPVHQLTKEPKVFRIVVNVEKKETPPGRTCSQITTHAEARAVGDVFPQGGFGWQGVGTGELEEKAHFIDRIRIVAWAEDKVCLDVAAAPKWDEEGDDGVAVIRGGYFRSKRWFKFGKTERLVVAWDKRGEPQFWLEVTVTEAAPE